MLPRRHIMRRRLLSATLLTATLVASGVAVGNGAPAAAAGAVIADGNWLGAVNAYRAMSGLDPVTENASWSAQARAHSCYMLRNGITHDEIPGRPGYTAGGDLAGNNGNVAASGRIDESARGFVDMWVNSPLHLIGMLRPNLTVTGFGTCTNPSTDWKSAATLDVLRGVDRNRPAPTSPVVFPGRDSTIPFADATDASRTRLGVCGWSGTAGLPLIVMMPDAVGNASASLRGPGGAIDVCEVHAGNVRDALHESILGPNTVLLIPRQPLRDGGYSVSLSTSGGSVNWSFSVDADAPLRGPDPAPDTEASGPASTFEAVAPFRLVDTRLGQGATRLAAGSTTRIDVADPSVTAVSANFVAVDPDDNGYLTAFNCTTRRPTVSNINYRTGSVIANQTVVPLDEGDLCLFSRAETDVVIDVNGFYRASSSGDRFVATTQRNLFDSRSSGVVRAGEPVAIPVEGIPGSATAVSLNVTAIDAPDRGWVKVAPCGAGGDAKISSLNYVAREVRSNSAVVPIGSGRSICVTSLRTMHVTIDVNGYFTPSSGLGFTPLSPIRLLDTRDTTGELNPQTNGVRLGSGEVIRVPVAGHRGVPASTRAVSINIASTSPTAQTAITAYPCGTRPPANNLNASTAQFTIGNGALIELAGDGELCLHASRAVHVIVDINGAWR